MKMWLCRDEDGLLNLFADTIPYKKIYERIVIWENDEEMGKIVIDSAEYPEVTFENSPMEVELKLVDNGKKG